MIRLHSIMATARGVAAGMLLSAAACAADADASAQINREQQVKAAYLYNFARFTTWPAEKFSGADDAVVFCVMEREPLVPAMAEAMQGKILDNRLTIVRTVTRVEQMRECHVAYLGVLTPSGADAALKVLASSSVLTVYESDSDSHQGIVRFFIEDRRLRFEINAAAAEREHVQLSARLLSVAKVVRD